MRDYSKVAPQFWIGETGKRLRGNPSAQIVALYLLTNPHANMLGLYYLPRLFISHETGLSAEGASKGLARCIEALFCGYDEVAEVVWVFEMARFQIGAALKADDKRCAGVQNDYDALPRNRFLGGFFDKYAEPFHLTRRREDDATDGSPSEGPSEALRSQEQEQEQEQEKEQEQKQEPAPPAGKRAAKGQEVDGLFASFWAKYPKKTGKADAEKAWKKLSAAEREKADAMVSVYAEAMADRPQYVKDPSGWLNGKRFDDDPSAWQPHGASRKTSDTAFPPTKPVGTKYADTPTVRL